MKILPRSFDQFDILDLADTDPKDKYGLVAFGSNLQATTLIQAYSYGFFPWSDELPPHWYNPDPRMVLFPNHLIVSHSMRSILNNKNFSLTADLAFDQVIYQCAHAARKGSTGEGSWIIPEINKAYTDLHKMGYVHSIEVWQNHMLVGGLYGLALGSVFFGESMFSLVSNTSKLALIYLVGYLKHKGYLFIDCQQDTDHIRSMGAHTILRTEFLEYLRANREVPNKNEWWTHSFKQYINHEMD